MYLEQMVILNMPLNGNQEALFLLFSLRNTHGEVYVIVRLSIEFKLILDQEDPWSRAPTGAEDMEVHGKGLLGTFKFGSGDAYARKSLADPDMVSHSWIHNFQPPGQR